jgi:hypothetical protein
MQGPAFFLLKRFEKNRQPPRQQEGEGDGEDPRPDDTTNHAPAHSGEAAGRTNAHDGGADDMGRADRNAEMRGTADDEGGRRFSGKAVDRLQLDDAGAQRADDTPTTNSRTQPHHERTAEFDPQRDGKIGAAIGQRQGEGDDAHRFLRVIHAVAKGHESRRYQLQFSEDAVDAVEIAFVNQPGEPQHHQKADTDTEDRRSHHGDDDFFHNLAGMDVGKAARAGKIGCSQQRADQSVRGTGGQSLVPGNQVPDDSRR